MSFFDLNRKISYEHININKTSTKKWYEQLGATSSTLYTYGTTENEIEFQSLPISKAILLYVKVCEKLKTENN